MISKNWLLAILITFLFFELTLIPFPVVFLISLVFYILYPEVRTVIFTTTAGLLLDILSVSIIGQTSLVILVSFLIIDIYKKAFEIRDWRASFVILFISTYIYAKIFSYETSPLLFIVVFGVAAILINYFMRGRLLWLK
ncbi:MAG: hypothetical protein HY427_01640 [Candidatus Levybacteria bacterium]|nr:hypothetical protein [Candidatus Levybacteria bacterium]